MGNHQSGRVQRSFSEGEEVNFDHFQILRAIGKGSFGKVCIVEKKDKGQMYAMKYMNKGQCIERDALRNVLREVEIMAALDHPFLVNMWFSFQDEEDLFIVSDLLLGGDLRYHVMHDVPFSEECVKLYVCELALALDYLQTKHVVHRDVKPDNILLDEEGHAHLTDFNIATVLEEGHLATSMSGTKPYMAPEIFDCAADVCVGYGFPVDWWSLGVCAYECARGVRPFDIHSATNISEVRALFAAGVYYPSWMSKPFVDLLSRLLCSRPGARISSLAELKKVPFMANVDFDAVLEKKIKPTFTPPRDHLNCDPTHELEEMIIEQRPLHKKKKRLAKQRSIREVGASATLLHVDGLPAADMPPPPPLLLPNFLPFNREREMARKERELKEQAWEQELLQAMGESGAQGAEGEGAAALGCGDAPARPASSTATPPPTPATPATPNSGTPPGSAPLTVSSSGSGCGSACGSRRVSRRSAGDAEEDGRRPCRLSSSGSQGGPGRTGSGGGRSAAGSRGSSPNVVQAGSSRTALSSVAGSAPTSPGDVFRTAEEEAALVAPAQGGAGGEDSPEQRLLLGREQLEQCLTHIAGFSSDLTSLGGRARSRSPTPPRPPASQLPDIRRLQVSSPQGSPPVALDSSGACCSQPDTTTATPTGCGNGRASVK